MMVLFFKNRLLLSYENFKPKATLKEGYFRVTFEKAVIMDKEHDQLTEDHQTFIQKTI